MENNITLSDVEHFLEKTLDFKKDSYILFSKYNQSVWVKDCKTFNLIVAANNNSTFDVFICKRGQNEQNSLIKIASNINFDRLKEYVYLLTTNSDKI